MKRSSWYVQVLVGSCRELCRARIFVVQKDECKEVCKLLLDFNPYPSTEVAKAWLHFKLGAATETNAGKAVGNLKYLKMLSCVSNFCPAATSCMRLSEGNPFTWTQLFSCAWQVESNIKNSETHGVGRAGAVKAVKHTF